MEVGLFLTNQQPLGRDMRSALDEQLEMTAFARDAGWKLVFTGHHYLAEGMGQLQPFAFLARLAAEAGDMRLGIGILLLTVMNPVDVAEQVASLDIITGGRFVLGVGVGYRDVEFAAFGVPKEGRLGRFEAHLNIVGRLCAGEAVDADLPWCHLDGARLSALPVQRPRPPIWIGATGDRAVARAGRVADGWIVNPASPKSTIVLQKQVFADAWAEASRPGSGAVVAFREVFCARDREAAEEAAAPYLADKYRAYASWGQERAHPGRASLEVPFAELARDRFILGSPSECLAELRSYRDDVGATHVVLRSEWPGLPYEAAKESLRLLAEEVVPAL